MSQMDYSENIAYRKLFTECLCNSFDEKHTFNQEKFFRNWFRENGKSYFFLFKKNLSRTSIQFPELFSLITVHSHSDVGSLGHLQFKDRRDFLTGLKETISALLWSKKTELDVANDFASLYHSSFWPVVVVEPLFGSCSVFLPPHINLDLKRICAESGYIHSCGTNVYTRAVEQATEGTFVSDLHDYLARLSGDKKLFFVVYAHEDFDDNDREDAAILRGGLDDVKLFIDKWYFADKRLVDVLNGMRQTFKDRLFIAPPGDFRDHRFIRQEKDVDPHHTIWLIIDRAIGTNPRHPGPNAFVICYDQEFCNDNQFHLFDENKPAWISHTTIPHTLIGAMLNITRPRWPTTRKTRIGDPFSGTGTTWLEAAKYPNVEIACADIDPLAPVLARDNLAFFAMSDDDLKTFKDIIDPERLEVRLFKSPEQHTEHSVQNPDDLFDGLYRVALDLFNKVPAGASSAIPNEVVEALVNNQDIRCRFLFYIVLRAHVRHFAALHRKSETWTRSFMSEAAVLHKQLTQMLELRGLPLIEECDSISVHEGTYSKSCTISTKRLEQLYKNETPWADVEVRDVRTPVRAGGQLDVIVADPPYGFNTEQEYWGLAIIYTKAIRNMIKCLADGGQLVISLPNASRTGRPIPAFATRQWITQQVIAEANRVGLEPIQPCHVMPRPASLFWPPYYWDSEKALSRVVLHFSFRTTVSIRQPS